MSLQFSRIHCRLCMCVCLYVCLDIYSEEFQLTVVHRPVCHSASLLRYDHVSVTIVTNEELVGICSLLR